MLNQLFISKEFQRLYKNSDKMYCINESQKFREFCDDAQLRVQNNQFLEGGFATQIVNKSQVYTIPSLEDKLIIRKIDDIIVRILKPKQANRDLIVKDIGLLMSEGYNYEILKLDIKSMYESISWDFAIEKLESSTMLISPEVFNLLSIIKSKFNGDSLIRGLSTSSILSELYMEEIDIFIKEYNGVAYYARYVDDIIIFFNSTDDRNYIEGFKTSLINKLDDKKTKLKLNDKKTNSIKLPVNKKDTVELEYLGYKFTVTNNKTKKNKGLDVDISIAEKKIQKIKRKIHKSFEKYIKSNQSNKEKKLLEGRIKFITSINKMEDIKMISFTGVRINYKLCTEDNLDITLNELDDFIKNKIYKYATINPSWKPFLFKLQKYSFGYERISSFSMKEIINIRRAWYYG